MTDIYTYEKSLKPSKKKSMGIFYTDSKLANYMINTINIKPSDKVIDPSCGNGVFIRCLIDKFKNKFIPSNVFGVDYDKDIINLLKDNLSNVYSENDLLTNIVYGNSLGNRVKCMNIKDDNDKYDFIIGNPPYVPAKDGKNYNSKLFSYKKYISTSVNLSMIMLVRSMDLIKEAGIISFILPKNILHVECYDKLRKELLSKYTIIEIVDLGIYFKGVRGEQIILTIKKKVPSSNHKIVIKHLINKKDFIMNSTEIKQNIFIKNNIIVLYSSNQEIELLEKLQNSGLKLVELVDGNIFRGVAVDNKNKTYKTYRGRDIGKFSVKECINANPIDLKNAKIQLLTRNKLILQNIFSSEAGIIASYVNDGSISNETVTNIVHHDDELLKYLLGLLNSKLINYYLIIKIYNDSRLTMHTDKKYIGEIPIIISKDYYYKIIKIVERALNKDYNKLPEITKEIDKLVYEIYKLEDSDIEIVENRIKNIFSEEWI